MRTGTVIANPEIKEAQFLKKIISTDYYSTELSNDLQGIELCGAIKNIYSMLIGAGEGSNTSSTARYKLKNVFPVPAIPCKSRCLPLL